MVIGEHKGKKVLEAKSLVKQDLIDKKLGVQYY